MQREARAGFVPVDETRVGRETGKATGGGCGFGELCEERGHGGPGLAGFGIDFGITIAFAIGDPANFAGIGNGNRHTKPAGGDHVAEGGRFSDLGNVSEDALCIGGGESSEQDSAFTEEFSLS